MSKNIRLHAKYGLNPTLSICFYCGKETGDIAILGANYDGEAPQHMCTSLEPCDECKEKFKDAVLVIEARRDERDKPIPTGRWAAIKKECVTVSNKGIMFADTETMNQLLTMSA